MLAAGITFGGFKWTGDFTTIDLIAATTNALDGALLACAVSARRLKGVGPLAPPGTSLVVAWAEGPLTEETAGRWPAPASQRLILRFNPAGDGALLEV